MTSTIAFVDEVDKVANEHDMPGYAMLVINHENVVVVVGGSNHEYCELLAEAHMQTADKLRQLLQLQLMDRPVKPS